MSSSFLHGTNTSQIINIFQKILLRKTVVKICFYFLHQSTCPPHEEKASKEHLKEQLPTKVIVSLLVFSSYWHEN